MVRIPKKEFNELKTQARRLLKDKKMLGDVLDQASDKATKHRKKIGSFWTDLKTLIRLVKAWGKGEYRQVPWKTLVAAVAAILYFLNPFDAIIDFLGVVGFIDDAMIVAFAFSIASLDLQKFKEWEKKKTSSTRKK